MPFLVEPARPYDLAPAVDLLRRADLPDHGVAEEFGHYLVVRDGTRVVGLCGVEVHGTGGLLRSLVVDPDYRGEGLGGMLVQAAEDLARKMEVGTLYLLTTTARDFFARRRFADCPRSEAPPAIRESWEFKSGCPQTAKFMKRALR